MTDRPSIDPRAITIADAIEPRYRHADRTYSCTGHVAKLWGYACSGAERGMCDERGHLLDFIDSKIRACERAGEPAADSLHRFTALREEVAAGHHVPPIPFAGDTQP